MYTIEYDSGIGAKMLRIILKYCVMILLVVRGRVIIIITTDADNDKRLK